MNNWRTYTFILSGLIVLLSGFQIYSFNKIKSLNNEIMELIFQQNLETLDASPENLEDNLDPYEKTRQLFKELLQRKETQELLSKNLGLETKWNKLYTKTLFVAETDRLKVIWNESDWAYLTDEGSYTLKNGSDSPIVFSGEEELHQYLKQKEDQLLQDEKNEELLYRKGHNYLNNSALKNALTEKSLALSDVDLIEEEFTCNILKGNEPILYLSWQLDGPFYINSNSYMVKEEWIAAITADLNGGTIESKSEKAEKDAFQRWMQIQKDPEWLNILAESHLTVSHEMQEDIDYYYFPLLHQNSPIGYIGIQKSWGRFYLLDWDQILSARLPFAATVEESSEEVLSSSEMVTDILLLGTHEKNTDTIMVVHLDDNLNEIQFVSLPRDLYFNNRRLNTVLKEKGPEQLLQDVRDLTKMQVYHYIEVDMYALKEIVDLFGGIDVTLSEPIEDPTYKIRKDGRWTTLKYDPGTYKMNGIETLRITRSRHGSNDFGRSEMQQKVLAAIWQRLSEIQDESPLKAVSLLSASLRYVSTNLKISQIKKLFSDKKDFSLGRRLVLSFDNILYYTYTGYWYRGLTKEDAPDDIPKGGYILLPKNDDWSIIPYFIYKELGIQYSGRVDE